MIDEINSNIPAWWLSFVDPAKPEGEQFLGICIVEEAVDMPRAVEKAWELGINPGGQVQGIPLSDWPSEQAHTLIRDREQALEIMEQVKAIHSTGVEA